VHQRASAKPIEQMRGDLVVLAASHAQREGDRDSSARELGMRP
jgi:hypothetical protein